MIVVTRLNESQFAVNPDLIERIHESPDTTLVMVDGAKYIVTESLDEVIDLITSYRARIISLARFLTLDPAEPADGGGPAGPAGHRPLGLVREHDAGPGTAHPDHTPDAGTPDQLRPRNT